MNKTKTKSREQELKDEIEKISAPNTLSGVKNVETDFIRMKELKAELKGTQDTLKAVADGKIVKPFRCPICDKITTLTCVECAEKEFTQEEKARWKKKIEDIKRWLKDIVWCNAHDEAWIEKTIEKLDKLLGDGE